jgi:hypothetical protein
MHKFWGTTATIGLTVGLCAGCGKGSTVSIPAITPIVQAAIPAGLKPGSTAVVIQHLPEHAGPRNIPYTTNQTLAQTYITNLFLNYFSGTQGYLLAQVNGVDARSALFNGQPVSSHPCLSAAPQAYTADYSALNPNDTTTPNMLKFSMQLQCTCAFNGSTNGSAGEVFGTSGTNTSIWVQVNNGTVATNGVQLQLANVGNLASTSTTSPESVDGLVINYNPGSGSTAPTINVARYKATPSLNTFELYFVGNQSGVGGFTSSGGNGGPTNLGAGFRMISDGVDIYADGMLCTDQNTSTCNVAGNWQPFAVCMNATTLALVDPTSVANCKTLALAFTLSPTPNSAFTSSSFTTWLGSLPSPIATTPLTFTAITQNGGTNYDSDLGNLGISSTDNMSTTGLTALSGAAVSNASAVTTAF